MISRSRTLGTDFMPFIDADIGRSHGVHIKRAAFEIFKKCEALNMDENLNEYNCDAIKRPHRSNSVRFTSFRYFRHVMKLSHRLKYHMKCESWCSFF